MESHIFVIDTSNETYKYTVQYPHNVSLPIVWMRSVNRDLLSMNIPKPTREQFFLAAQPHDQHDETTAAWNISTFNKRLSVKRERDVNSLKRVIYKVVKTPKALITREESYRRVRNAAIRSAKRMKAAQEELNQSVAPILCYALLKTEAKYQRHVRLNNALRSGPSSYGVSAAKQPTVQKVKKIADAIYTSPALLTNRADWVLRYRRGRLHKAGEHLALPNQKVSMTNIDCETYPRYEDIENAIIEKLDQVGLEVIATKIRIGEVLEKRSIAAIVYLQSAYHARVALKPLSHFGRVHLGETVATPRIVASKVKPTIQMLLTEADGCAADERLTEDQCHSLATQVDPIKLDLQIWLDKDGRISFIKIKIIDLSCTVFKRGHSRVAYLLEYIGDENECRQFIPSLVDEFAESNTHTFHLLSGLPVFAILVYITSDHKALFALTGRSGGNEHRDLFCHFSLASKYHLVLHQGETSFNYDDFIKLWEKINAEMEIFKSSLMRQNKACTIEMEKAQLNKLYRDHGRIDRVPAFMNGVSRARPEVTDHLVVTPLNLHNDTYANITTLTLLLEITEPTDELKRLQAMWKGLMDGFGQTKCATSGEGIRRLVNECLCLDGSIKAPHSQKFSPVWWLKDTISRHLRLTRIKDCQPAALTDHERLKFAAATLLWWLLLGDLSDLQGGRTLKGDDKNHLEDKIYPFELATACVDFEEVSHVPLSLLNESFFEATFSYRDEMINIFHTKVGIDQERKGKFFSDTLDQLVPNPKYRSHMGKLSRHQNRQIIICGCWTQKNKWSLNIKRRLLYRSATLSYHNRILSAHLVHMYMLSRSIHTRHTKVLASTPTNPHLLHCSLINAGYVIPQVCPTTSSNKHLRRGTLRRQSIVRLVWEDLVGPTYNA